MAPLDEDDDAANRCIALLCSSIKLSIDTGRAIGNTDTEILNVLYESCIVRINGFQDECLELTNRAKKMMGNL